MYIQNSINIESTVCLIKEAMDSSFYYAIAECYFWLYVKIDSYSMKASSCLIN